MPPTGSCQGLHLFTFLPYFYFWEQGWAARSGGLRSPVEPSPPVIPSLHPPHPFPVASDQVGPGTSSHLLGSKDGRHQTRTSLFGPWKEAIEGQEIIGI